ncbi:hypothetical protein [Zoogloea sp.]|uniref:hypothetical protein n=1 Tax=Zoogloea sp. TaxID=49181 RepID=UPI00141660CF|nr:MAG: hypothetical protein F9K15_16380 [Zoogloea sp.]
MVSFKPGTSFDFPIKPLSVLAANVVQSYTPPVSDIIDDPLKLFERQVEAQRRDLAAVASTPPGSPVPGTGPSVSMGVDAEWVHDPDTRTNRILSIQFHVVGECGEFSHIEYLKGGAADKRPEFAKLIAEVLTMGVEGGYILEWPQTVIVAAFFLRADLTAFGDLARFKTRLDSVGRSVGTRGAGIPFDVEFEPRDIERLTQARRLVACSDDYRRALQVKFIDLVRHVPAGTTLADVGALLGQPKIELPPGAIEHMDLLLADNPELYAKYAAQDALIAVYFLHRVKEVIGGLLERGAA